MKKISMTKKNALALCVLAAGALAAVAAPTMSIDPEPSGGERSVADTTISIKTSSDAMATVIHVPDLAMGETRTIRSDSGKDVLVTRTEEGYTVKIGEKEFQIRAVGGDGERVVVVGGPGEHENVRTIVSGDGTKKVLVTKHGYGFKTGEGPEMRSASELLEKHQLAALDGADRRTRETVAKAIDELVKKGVLIAPMLAGLPGSEDGERVEIRVTR